MPLDLLFALGSGVLVGLLLGSTGGGGSLIAIPLLVYLVGIPVQEATAMSLVVVGYSALFGAWQASRRGQVKGLAAVLFSVTGMVGAWIGAHGHLFVKAEHILFLFGGLLLTIGVWTFRRGLVLHNQRPEDGCEGHFSPNCAIKALGIGFGIGLLTGFFGIGGGFLIVPTLLYVMGFPIRRALGTSLLIIALTSLGGIIGHLAMTRIDFTMTGVVIVGSLAGMVIGTRAARAIPEDHLRKTLAGVVMITGMGLLIDNALLWFPD